MKISIDTDEATLKKCANDLAQNPNLLDDLAKNPQGVLGKMGITVDDETAKRISARVGARVALKSAPGAAAAAIVHVDT